MTMTDFGNAIADAVTDAVDRLRDETVDGELVRSVDEWAKVIRDDLDIANEGIISAGRHLIEAKRDVGHGNWLPLLEQIGIHERAAQRLMRIGSNEALTNPTNLSGLPSALSALVELAGVEPEDLQESIESGDVTPQTTAKDAKKLKEQKRDTAPIREWAKRNGIEVSDRGKLRADVVEAYERDCRTWLEAEHQHRAEQVASNYQKVAKQFDAVAAKFTKAARTVDPRSTADQVIELAPAVQQAWRDGRELAVELERVSIILRTALLLTGIPHPAQGIPTSSEAYRAAEQSFRIGLCCDTAGLHRRRVWEADAEGWAALVAAGVTLRAQPVDTFEPYRVPQQMMERRHADGTVELVDPHDGDLPPRPEDDTVGAWHPATAPGAIADPLEVHTHR